jgi:DNA-binding transcriptional LysR family regulator
MKARYVLACSACVVLTGIAAATLGVGLINVLAYQVADAVRADALRIVLADFESPPLPISLVHKGQAPLPLKLRAFLDFVTPRLRARITHEFANLSRAISTG